MASEGNYCSDYPVESFGRIACYCIVELGVDAGASLHQSNFAFFMALKSFISSHRKRG